MDWLALFQLNTRNMEISLKNRFSSIINSSGQITCLYKFLLSVHFLTLLPMVNNSRMKFLTASFMTSVMVSSFIIQCHVEVNIYIDMII